MSYQKFGISPQLVERVKLKMKNPVIKERLRVLLASVSKTDLQNRLTVRKLVKSSSVILSENLGEVQLEQIVNFVIAQKVDPSNTFHLLKLWSMFR